MNLSGINSSFNIKTFGTDTQIHSNNKTWEMLEELVRQLPLKAFYKRLNYIALCWDYTRLQPDAEKRGKKYSVGRKHMP